ncbi:MAG: tail fiber domain-containing protein [Bacteroidetes bacterium]|nr:tail fiber domain-containing protein [Bacteroidota bacterium]MBS1608636.1 tail fiber domain-containing protein [Bacteroidota bacterium]
MNNIIWPGKVIIISFAFICTSQPGFSQMIDDNEIKKNITTIQNPLEKLIQLEPKTFEYDKSKFKDLKLPSGKQYGFIAENVQQLFPDLVRYKNYSYSIGKNSFRTISIKKMDAESIIPVLVASIKEQQEMINKLQEEINELKNKSSSVKN